MRMLLLVRGIAGTAVTWAAMWAIAGAAVAAVQLAVAGTVMAFDPPVLQVATLGAMFYGIIGAWAGAFFAIVMALGDRRRSFADLSMARVMTWGAIGGISYPALFLLASVRTGQYVTGGMFTAFAVCTALGMASAWLMLTLARRTPHDPLILDTARRAEWSPSESIPENQTTRS